MSVVKSMSRGTRSFAQLADYILDEKKVLKTKDGVPYVFRHNLSGTSIDEIVKAFEECDSNREFRRKNSITLFHEVISWHAKDGAKITTESVEAISRKYVELRNGQALYFGAIHEDKNSRHLHLMISAVEAVSGTSIRISKERFGEIKKELQVFEQERIGLLHSTVEHGKGAKEKNDREYQIDHRTGKPSRKEEIKSILEKAFDDSMTQDEFYKKVRGSLNTYDRGGKIAGVDDERHYRFSTLGYGSDKIVELDRRSYRMDEMRELRETSKEQVVREVAVKDSEPENGDGDLADQADQNSILER